MRKLIKNSKKKMGLPPGTLIHTGEHKSEKAKISLISYNETQFNEKEVESIEESFQFINNSSTTWINVDAINHLEIIDKIGRQFNIHPLVLEDIVNTEQRPKLEDFENYTYIIENDIY